MGARGGRRGARPLCSRPLRLTPPRAPLLPRAQANDRFSAAPAQYSSFEEILDKFETERQLCQWASEEAEMM